MLGKAVRPGSGMKLTREEKRPSEAGVWKVNQPGFYTSTRLRIPGIGCAQKP